MKSILLSAAFVMLTFGVGLGMVYFIFYDQANDQTRNLLRRGLQETMLSVSAVPIDQRKAAVLNTFSDYITPDLLEGYETRIDLMDFHASPLAIRIKLTVTSSGSLFPIQITSEETMIEVQG